jgi:hypothetical protein
MAGLFVFLECCCRKQPQSAHVVAGHDPSARHPGAITSSSGTDYDSPVAWIDGNPCPVDTNAALTAPDRLWHNQSGTE